MKGRGFFLVLVAGMALSACHNGTKKSDEFRLAGYETMYEAIVPEDDFTSNISMNFSSPVEIANLLQIQDAPFSQVYLDSLLFLSLDTYNQIDRYLTENNRGQLSALIIKQLP